MSGREGRDPAAPQQPEPAPSAAAVSRAPSPSGGPLYRGLHVTTSIGMKGLFRPTVHGREHVPAEGPALLVANHLSYLDIPLLGTSVKRPMRFVARASLRVNPILAWLIRSTGSIPIEPRAADRRALEAIVERLRLGELVAMFPEGTRAGGEAVLPFRGGALLAARRAGAPLVPVGIRGTAQALPRGSSLPRPRKLEVAFGAPIGPREPDALERAREQVARLSGLPLRAAAAGASAPPAASVPSS